MGLESVSFTVVLSSIASVLSLFALIRTYVPPQEKRVRDLVDRVIGLEEAYNAIAARLARRVKSDDVAHARESLALKRERADQVTQKAIEIMAAHQQAAPAATLTGKAALRRQFGLIR